MSSRPFLVFGGSGQVGRELAIELGHGAVVVGHGDVDIIDQAAVREIVDRVQPSAVINAAAYTAVDKAEDDADLAFAVNGDGPGNLARACDAVDIPLVHISTDYVFDGEKTRAWREDDQTNPQNVYGRSKHAGELQVLELCRRPLILRTSWVFSEHGGNFVRTMLRLAQDRTEISVVDDQFGGPTAANDIAKAAIVIANASIRGSRASGVYHFSGAPTVSWHGFAQEIMTIAGKSHVRVLAIPTSAYPTRARRPSNSVLDCGRIADVFGIQQPDWKSALKQIIGRLGLEGIS